jgi:D-alanine-D-alanine ligase
MRYEINDEIVLVASAARRPHEGYKTLMSRFDTPKLLSNRILLHSLRKVSKTVHYYSSIEPFLDNIQRHKNHLIFPYFYGVGSRINNSFVQSICESSGIRFVGPEPYALTICNDKVLSKDICRAKRLRTPNCAVIYTSNDKPALDFLSLPLIVKPVFEGNSIGITNDSLCNNFEEALWKARELYQKIMAPVMLEEFIDGVEVNVCILGNGKSTPLVTTVTLNKKGFVFDYNQKHKTISLNRYPLYEGPEVERQIHDFLDIFSMLGKVEFMRIDCIVKNEELYCIELTPDADLSISSALYRSVSMRMDYVDFLKLLIKNSLESYRNR